MIPSESNMLLQPEYYGMGDNCSLPFYMRMLLKERDEAYLNYKHCRTQANNITFFEMNQICKLEMSIIRKTGTVDQPNSLVEIQKNIESAITAGYQLYGETNEQRFLDMLVGLVQVKDVVKEIKELKRNEYSIMRAVYINEHFAQQYTM